MNNSKLWLVVSPNVGIPIFLGAVAVGSFAVHVAVLNNTSWVSDFLSGKPIGSGTESAKLDVDAVKPATLSSPAAHESARPGQEIEIRMPDGSVVTAVIKEPEMVSAALRPPG